MIVTELMGGMGNQMFQYALGRHLSIKHDTNLVLDTDFLLDRSPRENFVYRDFDLSIFNVKYKIAPKRFARSYGINQVQEKNFLDKILAFPKLTYVKEGFFHFNPEVLNAGNNVYLNGYWQSQKYFTAIEDVIRRDFTFKTEMTALAKSLSNTIRASNAVCINVRRGDFVNHPILGSIGTGYYTAAFAALKQKVSNPVIYIFSDEIEWCKNNLAFDGEMHFVSHEYAGEKFRDYLELMSMCKYFIIPNSTFAWWAAWLSNSPEKIVIAPKTWFTGGDWSDQDIVPETWIRI